jgi:hypothetical protein
VSPALTFRRLDHGEPSPVGHVPLLSADGGHSDSPGSGAKALATLGHVDLEALLLGTVGLDETDVVEPGADGEQPGPRGVLSNGFP